MTLDRAGEVRHFVGVIRERIGAGALLDLEIQTVGRECSSVIAFSTRRRRVSPAKSAMATQLSKTSWIHRSRWGRGSISSLR